MAREAAGVHERRLRHPRPQRPAQLLEPPLEREDAAQHRAAARRACAREHLVLELLDLGVELIDHRVVNAALHSGIGPLLLGSGLMFEAVGAWWMRELLRAPLRRQQGSVADALPELVDLLSLALAAGCTVPAAIHSIATSGNFS